MDLDIDQVLMYILRRPLFDVVDNIKLLYRIAAELASNENQIKIIIVAVAKEFLTVMELFAFKQNFDFRTPINPLVMTTSSSVIASRSWVLRSACSYAAACSSAAADIFRIWLQDNIINSYEETKNDLRFLIQHFQMISVEFRCVSEMIFGDRPSDPRMVHAHILQSIAPWPIFFPPPVHYDDDHPRNNNSINARHDHRDDLVLFNGVVPLDMITQIISSLSYLQIAIVATRNLVAITSRADNANVEWLSSLMTDMISVHSVLDRNFPRGIQASHVEAESNRDHLKILKMMLSRALDVVTMAAATFQSFCENPTGVGEGTMEGVHYAEQALFHVSYRLGDICWSLEEILMA